MPDPSAPPGVDSCTNGYCTAFGASQGRQCARYCDVATEATNCASGQKCFSQADPYGLCRRICDPFGAMSQCPQANSMFPTQACSWQILVNQTASDAFCDVIGATVALGGACNPSAATPLDCQQGGVCLGDNVCHKLCDTTPQHACPAGQQCIGAQYLASDGATVLQAPGPNGGGWCITPMDAGTSILYTRPLVWQKNLKGGYK